MFSFMNALAQEINARQQTHTCESAFSMNHNALVIEKEQPHTHTHIQVGRVLIIRVKEPKTEQQVAVVCLKRSVTRPCLQNTINYPCLCFWGKSAVRHKGQNQSLVPNSNKAILPKGDHSCNQIFYWDKWCLISSLLSLINLTIYQCNRLICSGHIQLL